MITLEDAQNCLLSLVNVIATEHQPLEKCFNRILAQDIYATYDFPPFNRSPLDAYAVLYSDVKHANPNAPVELKVIDNVPAGTVSTKIVTTGTAMRIMTGAPIPAGANAVVRLEDTTAIDNKVFIRTGKGSAQNICSRGEEIADKERILAAGSRIDSNSIGLLAMFGITSPLVYAQPMIGIISTGSEIIRPTDELTPGKIRDTNSQMLMMEVLEAGGVPIMLGKVPDDIESIAQMIMDASMCELILTTGGASVGDHDLMGRVYKLIGAKIHFSRVAIKPGMPVLAATLGNRLLVGLSGNPAAASVSYKLLVQPVIRKMHGDSKIGYPRTRATLSEVFIKSSPTHRFVWGKYSYTDTGIQVTPLLHQGNGMLRSRPESNCLIVIPPENSPYQPGDKVEILILE